MTTSPPEFIVAFSKLIQLRTEEIRLAKRNERGSVLENRLNVCIYKLCGVSTSNSGSDVVGAVSRILIALGYTRCWYKSVQERLYAITWLTVMSDFWGRHLTQEIYHSCSTFANISNLWCESLFRLKPASVQTIVELHPRSNYDPNATSHLITSLYGGINQKLKILKSLDEMRCRLQGKIAGRIQSLELTSDEASISTVSPVAISKGAMASPLLSCGATNSKEVKYGTKMMKDVEQRQCKARSDDESSTSAVSTGPTGHKPSVGDKLLYYAPAIIVPSSLAKNRSDGRGAAENTSTASPISVLQNEVRCYENEVIRRTSHDTANRLKFLEWIGRSVVAQASTKSPIAPGQGEDDDNEEDSIAALLKRQLALEESAAQAYDQKYHIRNDRDLWTNHASNCDIHTDENNRLLYSFRQEIQQSVEMVATLEESVCELMVSGKLQNLIPPPPPSPPVLYKPFSTSPVASSSRRSKKYTTPRDLDGEKLSKKSGSDKRQNDHGDGKQHVRLDVGTNSDHEVGEAYPDENVGDYLDEVSRGRNEEKGLAYLKRLADDEMSRHIDTCGGAEIEVSATSTGSTQIKAEETGNLSSLSLESIREKLIHRQYLVASISPNYIGRTTLHQSHQGHRDTSSSTSQSQSPRSPKHRPGGSEKPGNKIGCGSDDEVCQLCIPSVSNEDYTSVMRTALCISAAVPRSDTFDSPEGPPEDDVVANVHETKTQLPVVSRGLLQDVSVALSALRGHHRGLFSRVAKAAEKYSPYEFVSLSCDNL